MSDSSGCGPGLMLLSSSLLLLFSPVPGQARPWHQPSLRAAHTSHTMAPLTHHTCTVTSHQPWPARILQTTELSSGPRQGTGTGSGPLSPSLRAERSHKATSWGFLTRHWMDKWFHLRIVRNKINPWWQTSIHNIHIINDMMYIHALRRMEQWTVQYHIIKNIISIASNSVSL